MQHGEQALHRYNTTAMVLSLLVLLILFIASGLVSGAETALFALSTQDRRAFAESPSRWQRMAVRLMQNPRRVLMTVLITNTAINVGAFAVAYVAFRPDGQDGSRVVAAIVGIVSLAGVLLVGEVAPKSVALAHARKLAPYAASIIHLLQIGVAPVREVLRFLLIEPLTRLIAPARPADDDVTGDDLRRLVELSADQDIITTNEHNMLQAVVSLTELAVRSVMIPRVDIKAVSRRVTRGELIAEFERSGLKKLPVYGKDLDDIQGLLYARDLYLQPEASPGSLIRPVTYVPDLIDLLQLIRLFRERRVQIALAVDEYGGVSGLVSMEDVFEHIVGDLEAGDGDSETPIERIGEHAYLLSGALNLRAWRQTLRMADRFPEVDTIGGVVVAALGRAPRVGDTVQLGNLRLRVERLRGRRIERVRLDMATPPGTGAITADQGAAP